MPSDQQMQKWQSDTSSAPKHVKKHLASPHQASQAAPAPAPAPAPAAPGLSSPHPAQQQNNVVREITAAVFGSPAPKATSSFAESLQEIGHARGYDQPKPEKKPAETAPSGGNFWDSSPEDFLGLAQTHGGGAEKVGAVEAEQAKAAAVQHQADDRREMKQERSDALGISTGALVSAKPQLEELTAEAYAKLSDRQRAAVDFNTMLSTAVHKDKKRQDDYAKGVDPTERATYNKSVTDMFGPDGGSDLYAPETVAVLRQLKIEDSAADLDQYLGLQVAITTKDLRKLDSDPTLTQRVSAVSEVTPQTVRSGVQNDLVGATQDLQETLTKGKQMLQSFQAEAAKDRSFLLEKLGTASPNQYRPDIGYKPASFTDSGAPANVNTYYQMAFDELSRGKDKQAILGMIQNDLHPDEVKGFKSYVEERTNNAEFYDAELGLGSKDIKYMQGDRYRELLGLGE